MIDMLKKADIGVRLGVSASLIGITAFPEGCFLSPVSSPCSIVVESCITTDGGPQWKHLGHRHKAQTHANGHDASKPTASDSRTPVEKDLWILRLRSLILPPGIDQPPPKMSLTRGW